MTIDLRLGDCIEVMKTIQDNSIDAVITSPPFNLGSNHHTGGIRHNPYDDNMPEENYQKWQIDVLMEIYRVLRDDGSLFYQHKNRIKNGVQITPYQWILKTDFVIKQELVWRNGSQNFDKIRFYPQTERVYWLAKSAKTKIFNSLNATDMFSWKASGTDKEHTRMFPLDFPLEMIACLPDAKIILDPFMGSGTTGRACVQTNRDFIGIEIKEKYFEMASRNINEEKLKLEK